MHNLYLVFAVQASEGYQKVSKKLVEQKLASNRLWGAGAADMD
jgi:hypothetical protein